MDAETSGLGWRSSRCCVKTNAFAQHRATRAVSMQRSLQRLSLLGPVYFDYRRLITDADSPS